MSMSETRPPAPGARSGCAHSQPAGQPAPSSGGMSAMSRRTFIATAVAGAAVLAAKSAKAATTPIGPGSVFRIHPGIGIARMGNADPEQLFIGPEVPGYGPSGNAPGTAVPPYKASGLIKPQAARF